MLLPHGAIVAVIDGKNLELHRNSGNEAAPVLSALKAPKLDEHNRDSGSRHVSSSANPTGNQLDEDSHAAAVAAWLNRQASERQIEHLVVIAAPRTMGELRRHYTKPLEAALIGELHKDLIGRSGAQILEALQDKK